MKKYRSYMIYIYIYKYCIIYNVGYIFVTNSDEEI